MPDRAPKTYRHVCAAHGKVDQCVRYGVGMVRETGHCLVVNTVLQRHAQQLGKNRRGADAHMQGLRFTGCIHRSTHAHQAGRAVQIVLHVFFTAPHQLDRFARQLHGDSHRLAGEILRTFAAQSAAHLHGEDAHIFLRHLGGRSCRCERGFRVLGRRPDVEFVVDQQSRANHGLHGGVRQIRCVVICLYHFGRRLQCSQGVAVVAGSRNLCLCQTVAVILHQTGAVDAAVLAVVPIDRDIAQSFFGAPPVVGHHGDKFAQIDDFDYAAPVVHFAAVYRFGGAAEHRRLSDGRMQHARQLHIHTVADLAGDDVGDVYARQRFACQRPGFRVFERNVFGRCQLGCLGCQLAVAEFFMAGVVQHMS